MKKSIKAITIASILAILVNFSVMAYGEEISDIEVGTYIQLGKYNGESIVWRCIDNDENGKLILSDKILCYKVYDVGDKNENRLNDLGWQMHDECGNGFWEESQIRAWLNAKEFGGSINWPSGYAPSGNPMNNGTPFPYDTEDGFLSPANFTETELSVMKTTAQWQILSSWNKELSTNGVSHVFQANALIYGDGRGDRGFLYRDVTKLNHVEGAMYRLSDTMFLLDVRQIYKLWSNFGTVAANPTNKLLNSISDNSEFLQDGNYRYCLRTPTGSCITYVYGDTGYNMHVAAFNYGIRPAFYLNEDNYKVLSGSGTEADPYVVDGKFEQESTAVFSQGNQLSFDQEPMEENGRLLVPVRAIFESLGAEVTYDDGDGVIIASDGERTVTMQIGNPEMGNGTEVFTLDTVPKIVGDRTMVPLRAVAEAFDCKVDYIENLNRVVIDKPTLPMDFGDGVGREDWQQNWYKEIYGD